MSKSARHRPSEKCQYTPEGMRHLKCAQREGRVIGKSRDGQRWWVRWNDLKTAYAYHKSFIEILPWAS